MRDILFKAKRKDNGEWVEGDLVHSVYKINDICVGKYGSEVGMHQVDESTICQYIGLKDKNGNKIWGNDVVRDTYDDMSMVVRWDEEKLRFVLDYYGYSGCLMEYGYDETAGRFDVVDTYGFDDFYNPDQFFEVIGNIFDNAELLEG